MKVKYILAPKLSRYVPSHAYDYTAYKKINYVLILHMCNITILTLQIMKNMLKINTSSFTLHADNAEDKLFWHQLAIFCRDRYMYTHKLPLFSSRLVWLIWIVLPTIIRRKCTDTENKSKRKRERNTNENDTNFLQVEPNLTGVFLSFYVDMLLDSKVNQHLPDLSYTYAITSCLIKI